MSNFDQLYMCILNLYHIKPEVSMVWQMYIFCHHNTCSFHFCGTKLMYVYCIKRVPRLHQRAPNGTQIFKISRGRPPSMAPKYAYREYFMESVGVWYLCMSCWHKKPDEWSQQSREISDTKTSVQIPYKALSMWYCVYYIHTETVIILAAFLFQIFPKC